MPPGAASASGHVRGGRGLTVGETLLSKGLKQLDRVEGGWKAQLLELLHNGWITAGLVLLLGISGFICWPSRVPT